MVTRIKTPPHNLRSVFVLFSVVPPLLHGWISKCGHLLPIECQTIGIMAKQQDLGASGLDWPDQRRFEELRKPSFPKGDHMSHVVPCLLLGVIWTCGYLLQIDCQAIGINAKKEDLRGSGPLRHYKRDSEEMQKTRFAKRNHMSHVFTPFLLGRISARRYLK